MAAQFERALLHMNDIELTTEKAGFVGPTFSLANRIRRTAWMATWFLAARWTPPYWHQWRIAVLRLFGANISWQAYVYPDVKIWAPWNLTIAKYGTLARNVTCYNIAPISIGERAVISQNAHLCTGSHDYLDPAFPLTAKRIEIGRRSWICADAFIGPGVNVGDGTVLAARGVTFKDLEPWSIHMGNPAFLVRKRPFIEDK